MPSARIYLDHAATSPLVPAAREAMIDWLDAGNPSSLYAEGRRAKAAIDAAREIVSRSMGCEFGEVIFTSGGTEAANMAVLGSALAAPEHRRRVLLGAAEHHCVLHTREALERLGFTVDLLPVDRFGRVQEATVPDDTFLVAVMHANNEFGAVNDVATLARAAHRAGALVFVDAVQTFRAWPWKVGDLYADMVSVSAHKIGGPKGVGALYIKGGVKPKPWIVGGGQEREMRAGTENVAGIVGFAAAVETAVPLRSAVRDAFEAALDDLAVFTVPSGVPRLPGHSHLRFPGIAAESLLIRLDRMGVAASAGAACSSGALEPSHVMLAAGYPVTDAKEAVRFSFGRSTTLAEAKKAAERVREAVEVIRAGRL